MEICQFLPRGCGHNVFGWPDARLRAAPMRLAYLPFDPRAGGGTETGETLVQRRGSHRVLPQSGQGTGQRHAAQAAAGAEEQWGRGERIHLGAAREITGDVLFSASRESKGKVQCRMQSSSVKVQWSTVVFLRKSTKFAVGLPFSKCRRETPQALHYSSDD